MKIALLILVLVFSTVVLAIDQEKQEDHEVKIMMKPGKGVTFISHDNRFKFNTSLRAMFLYDYKRPEDGPEPSQLFQIRRARLYFQGHVWGKHNIYKVELALSPRDLGRDDLQVLQSASSSTTQNIIGHNPVLSWYMQFNQLRDASLRMGQYKIPYSRQRVISSGKQQLVDRSIANAEFNLDRDLGFDLRSSNLAGLNSFKYYAGLYIGEGRNASDHIAVNNDLGLMYLFRIEYFPFGIFKSDYSESNFTRNRIPEVSIAASGVYLQNVAGNRGILGSSVTPRDGASVVNSNHISTDIMIKYLGASLQAEWHWREFQKTTEGRNGFGGFIQLGYFVYRDKAEFAARVGANRNFGSYRNIQDINEAGAGFNYFIDKHYFKLQFDVFHLYEPHKFAYGTTRFRAQLQASF